MTEQGRALAWRCRRGTLELDTLMMRYLRHRYPAAPTGECDAFARLADFPDPVLFDLLIRRIESDEQEIAHVVERILAGPCPSS